MKNIFWVFATALMLFSTVNSSARENVLDLGDAASLGYPDMGVSIAAGRADRSIIPVRLSVQKDFGFRLRPNCIFPLGGYFEGSLYYMQGKKTNPEHHHRLAAAAIAGVFRFEKRECTFLGWPYVEIGLGLSLVTPKEISGKYLGTNFQFEDKVGAGIRFGENREFDLGIRLVHFSNASLHKKNSGINLAMISLGYWF